MFSKIPDLLAISPKYIFLLFVLIHLAFFGINATEWGDSYRILRAAEYVRDYSYPPDEKRPPLFSALLALRPLNVDQIVWSRSLMFAISLVAFYVFYNICKQLLIKQDKINLALLLFVLNPTFMYWSLRVMADVPFALFVLLGLYTLLLFSKTKKNIYIFLLGLIGGLSIMTRFEGYVLAACLFAGVTFPDGIYSLKIKEFYTVLLRNIRYMFFYIGALLTILVPYILWRNPFTSTYFEEPSNRAYDLSTILIYSASLFCIFGIVPMFSCIALGWKLAGEFLKKNPFITTFLAIELVLILAWPAAIPRIFTPIIPLLCIVFAYIYTDIIGKYKGSLPLLFINSLLVLFYIYIQYTYKLQFLILQKPIFVLVIILSLLQVYFLYLGNLKYLMYSFVFCMFTWLAATIYLHKDIFVVLQKVNTYAVTNLVGNIGYNDVSSVTNWYLNDSNTTDNVSGFYYDLTDRKNRGYEALADSGADYLLVTNEHNTDMTLDVADITYLKEIYSFEREINGKVFFTKIIKFERVED